MATKLRKVTSPKVLEVEEKIIEAIQNLMAAMLDHPEMRIEDKKELIQKIIRLSSGL